MKFSGLLTLFLLIGYPLIFAQNAKIDSLNAQIESDIPPNERADVYNQLGYEYWIIDPKISLHYGDSALMISIRENYLPGIAFSKRVIGVANWAIGWYEPALNNLYQSKEVYEKIKDSLGVANCIMNIGMVYCDQDDGDKSLEFYKNAIQLFDQLGENGRIATTYNKMATVFTAKGEFDTASSYLKKALLIHKDEKFIYGQAESLNRLGLLYREMKRFEEGIQHLKSAAEKSAQINDLDGLAKTYENLSSIYLILGDNSNALKYAQLAEEKAIENGSAKWLSDIYNDLMQVYQNQGNYQKAIQYYDKHIHYRDSLFNQKVAQDIANLHARMDKEKYDTQIQLRKQEIDLLEQKARTNQIMGVAAAGGIILLAIIGFLAFRNQRLKMKKNRVAAQMEQDRLTRELQIKGQELTSYTVNFIRKNELLEELKQEILEMKKSSDNGISGKLTRLGKIVDSHQQVDKDWEDFKLHFESVHKDFFIKLKAINSSLTSNDLKLCALIRLNLTMKEMAQMLGISTESVKTARYRLRKKLELNHEDSLNDFLINLDEEKVTK